MKTATVETISEIITHPNADSLEIAKIQGWQCVVRKGEFKAGEKVVFIPIDVILPDAPWSAFLKRGDKRIRLKTIKLRGEYSQGLVLNANVLPGGGEGLLEGDDVGEILGVIKYEKELHGPSSAGSNLSGDILCTFPTDLAPKTDEDNALSNKRNVLRHDCVATLKLDGSSGTIIVENGKILHVCSRNMSLRESDTNAFWVAARKATFPSYFTGVVQGELMGPGIQGNQLAEKTPTLYVYQIRLNGKWLDHEEMTKLATSFGLKHVWMIGAFPAGTSIEHAQSFADNLTYFGVMMEGIVVRPIGTPASGIGRPLGVKFINRNYDIKN